MKKPSPTVPELTPLEAIEHQARAIQLAVTTLLANIAEMKGAGRVPVSDPSRPAGAKGKRDPITPEEAARRLGIDQVCKHPKRTIQGMARRGELRSFVIARHVMIDPDSVDEMLGGIAIEPEKRRP